MADKRRYGTSHIENSIINLLRPLHKKDKKNFLIIGNIIKNWEKVVGKKYSSLCTAKSISFNKHDNSSSKKAKLIINVYNPAVGFFLQNNSELILDRIAQLYGYRAINKIIIKQETKEVKNSEDKKDELTKKQENTLEKQLENIQDPGLKEILSKLGANFMSSENK